MNGLEKRYAATLEVAKNAGVIRLWDFESIKFRLAKSAWYTPDFFVVTSSGMIEIHETKGHWEVAARVRIKAAARLYPWALFVAITEKKKRDGGGWVREVFASE